MKAAALALLFVSAVVGIPAVITGCGGRAETPVESQRFDIGPAEMQWKDNERIIIRQMTDKETGKRYLYFRTTHGLAVVEIAK